VVVFMGVLWAGAAGGTSEGCQAGDMTDVMCDGASVAGLLLEGRGSTAGIMGSGPGGVTCQSLQPITATARSGS